MTNVLLFLGSLGLCLAMSALCLGLLAAAEWSEIEEEEKHDCH